MGRCKGFYESLNNICQTLEKNKDVWHKKLEAKEVYVIKFRW